VLVKADLRTIVDKLAERHDVSIIAISNHLEQIRQLKKMKKLIPDPLREKQNFKILRVCSFRDKRNNIERFLVRIFTYDEKEIYFNNYKWSV
jgi:hypothetical protein